MPDNKRVVKKLIGWKYPSVALIAGGIFVWDQARRLKRNLEIIKPEIILREVKKPEYIYIRDSETQEVLLSTFQADGIANELYKITRLYCWLFGQFKGSEFYENVFAFHQSLAWRYLRVAQSKDYSSRLWAVKALGTMPSLSDSTCRQLAQACDQKTAVGLARTQGVDLRLFLDPPHWDEPSNRRALVRKLHEFMLALVREMPHPCLQYVISASFTDGDDNKSFDDDVGFLVDRPDVIPKCVEAILHHSWLGTNALSIVKLGGLQILVDVFKEVYQDPQNIETITLISRILSNVSMHETTHQQLFSSGCMKILAHLLKYEDIRVSVPAARALINCDPDETPRLRYLRNVYCLHPVYRSGLSPTPIVDVIFVHGLLGGVFRTWRQRDIEMVKMESKGDGENSGMSIVLKQYLKDLGVDLDDLPTFTNVKTTDIFRWFRHIDEKEEGRTLCWPRDWLAKDCQNLRIIGVNYDTDISKWGPMCPIAPPRQTLSDRSSHLVQALCQAGVGSRPIVWVAHSMGGLIVKDLLVKCQNSEMEWQRSIVRNTKEIVFFSTPHKGTRLAAMNTAIQLLFWPSIEVMELRQNSPPLLKLHEDFLQLLANNRIGVKSFAETKSTHIKPLKMELMMVERESADVGIGELYGVPLDHLCICKPANKQSFIYQKVLQWVVEAVDASRKQKKLKKKSHTFQQCA